VSCAEGNGIRIRNMHAESSRNQVPLLILVHTAISRTTPARAPSESGSGQAGSSMLKQSSKKDPPHSTEIRNLRAESSRNQASLLILVHRTGISRSNSGEGITAGAPKHNSARSLARLRRRVATSLACPARSTRAVLACSLARHFCWEARSPHVLWKFRSLRPYMEKSRTE
jgi:hypothetical protein